MAQTTSVEAKIFESETSGHQHPRTEISQNVDQGAEIFRNVIQETSAEVTTPPHHPTTITSQFAAGPELVFMAMLLLASLLSTSLLVASNCGSSRTMDHLLTLDRAVWASDVVLTWLLTFTRAVRARGVVLTWLLTFTRAVAMVVAIIIFSLAMFTFISCGFILILNHGFMLILSRVSRGFMLILSRVSHGFMLILSRVSRGFMLILSRGSSNGIILIRGVSSSPAEISSAPEAESSAPTNAATASFVLANAALVNAATASVPVNATTASVPEAESSALANADESSQGAFVAAIAPVNAVADRKQLVPIIISVLGTFMSIVAATLMLDKDVSHSIRDLGLAVFYLQVLAMICLLVGMGIKQLLGMGIKQQLLFVVGIVMASVSVLFMVLFISLVFIVASKK